MRIGILTLPLHTNYGGILQAYALQTVLERMGHEVVLITKSHANVPLWRKYFSIGKRILKNILGRRCDVFLEKRIPFIVQHTNAFIRGNIHQVLVNDFSDLNEENFDAIVVGSDQVWRPQYFKMMFHSAIEVAYLDFAMGWNTRRIAYAASFGAEAWEYTEEETKNCAKLAKVFDAVSVREDSAVEMCKNYLGVHALHLPDPTLLLSVGDYIHLFEGSHVASGNVGLMTYILDNSPAKKNVIDRVSQRLCLKPYETNAPMTNCSIPLEQRVQPPVEKWLRSFYDAQFVVTDSFHACVFSIIFNKPFIVIANENRGLARFTSLLHMFGLEDRLVFSDGNTVDELCDRRIDFDRVNSIKSAEKDKALRFLSGNLGVKTVSS